MAGALCTSLMAAWIDGHQLACRADPFLGAVTGWPSAVTAHIETNSDLTEAFALYESAGWEQVEAFNDEPFADRRPQKSLTP
jgi:hypothetical protein